MASIALTCCGARGDGAKPSEKYVSTATLCVKHHSQLRAVRTPQLDMSVLPTQDDCPARPSPDPANQLHMHPQRANQITERLALIAAAVYAFP